jgi:hypothetical protein
VLTFVSIIQFTMVGKFQSIMHVIARNKFELKNIDYKTRVEDECGVREFAYSSVYYRELGISVDLNTVHFLGIVIMKHRYWLNFYCYFRFLLS